MVDLPWRFVSLLEGNTKSKLSHSVNAISKSENQDTMTSILFDGKQANLIGVITRHTLLNH